MTRREIDTRRARLQAYNTEIEKREKKRQSVARLTQMDDDVLFEKA